MEQMSTLQDGVLIEDDEELCYIVGCDVGNTYVVQSEGRYYFKGVRPDRVALLMLSRMILDDATREESELLGLDDWR